MSRDRILEAAARVYARHGFRGTTTRRIAEEAGVNEVTIFRQFGSKGALIDEVVRLRSAGAPVALLPDEPSDPERELVAWCTAQLAHLRGMRSIFRKTMGELEEHPSLADCTGEGAAGPHAELRRYVRALQAGGYLSPPDDVDPAAATAMLTAALFGDAMMRDIRPELYPRPASQAPAKYVRVFLHALGVRPRVRRAAPRVRRPATSS